MNRLAVIALVFFALNLTFAQESLLDLLVRGDAAYDQFDNLGALEFYAQVVELDSNNCEGLWKTSRAHIDLGEIADKDKQREHYYQGEAFAREAVIKCPENADTHLSLAIAVGRVALMEGGKKKVKLSREVKAEAEKTLDLDPQKDIAHHVLARWHREVANLSGFLKMFAKILYGGLPPASIEKAAEHFKKAVEIKPNYINHHLELGITYESMKEWDLAKTEYTKVAELPVTAWKDNQHKEDAAKRLEKVLKKLD